jgi:hypothetical protein
MQHPHRLLLGVLLLAAACTSSAGERASTTRGELASDVAVSTTTSANDERLERRLEDLKYLDEHVVRRHPNPFWRAGEQQYIDQLQGIENEAADLTDDEFALEVIRLVALIDGHSMVATDEAPLDFGRLQIRTYLFDDGLFVLNSHDPEAVGARVTAVGGVPIDEAIAIVEPYVPRDNDMTLRLLLPLYLTYVELLGTLGLIGDDTPAYTVETRDGHVLDLDPPVLGSEELSAWLDGSAAGLAPRGDQVGSPSAGPLYLADPDRGFWWTYLPDSGTVFIQMNRISSTSSNPNGGLRIGLHALVGEVEKFVDENAFDRVVLDLRHNPGGNNTTYGAMLELLSTPLINQQGRLFVIVGRQTFSAAMNLATEIENDTEAIFAGEPTGARPNLYGDVNELHLPNSGITVRISSKYWPFGGPDDTRPWIPPEIDVPLTSSDYFAGTDPVLEAIIDY